MKYAFAIILLSLFLVPNIGKAHARKQTRILFILDCSLSMENKMEGERRMDVAKQLLIDMVDSLKNLDFVELGIRAYGHRSPTFKQDCKDTRLEVGFEPDNTQKIKEVISELKPRGTTPIAYSLSQSRYDFPNKKTQNVIILITDGAEECKGNPCEVSKELQEEGFIIRPFIIGIGLSDEVAKSFDCVGTYYNTTTKRDFSNVIRKVITQALDNTTAQVYLEDESGNPTETNVNILFTNQKTGEKKFNYIHSLGKNNLPDTFKIEPKIDYQLTVFTKPVVEKKDIQVIPAKHNLIKIKAPQGKLNIKMVPFEGYIGGGSVLLKHNQKIFNIHNINSIQTYLCGTYEVEALTLPKWKQTIKIPNKETKDITIPQAGKLTFKGNNAITGDIFVSNNTTKTDWIYKLKANNPLEDVYLLPGKYVLVYRSLKETDTEKSISQEFTINSALTTQILIK